MTMTKTKGRLLLINPWIYDFAAYELWIEPIGLLSIASILREYGYDIDFVDCLDRWNPELLKLQGVSTPKNRWYGTGNYYKEEVERPEPIKNVPRRYGRYGITLDIFESELDRLQKPELILVTSKMTYWYPGPFEVIRRVKRRYRDVPVLLGGTYATLCHEHAKEKSGADFIVSGEAELKTLELVDKLTGNWSDYSSFPKELDKYPFPVHGLRRNTSTVALLTSRGCPLNCSYCATRLLNPGFRQRTPENVLDEIDWCYHELDTRNFAFYDDALLVNAREHLHPILDGIIARKLDSYFHLPNSMHVNLIDYEITRKMYEAGFKTIRVSLETSNIERQRMTGKKIKEEKFVRAVHYLKKAGFTSKEVGAYIMMGLPGQSLDEVRESINFVHKQGIQAKLALFSPIPHTLEWKRAVREYRFDLSEPLLHNNTVIPYLMENTKYREEFDAVKALAREGNEKIKHLSNH